MLQNTWFVDDDDAAWIVSVASSGSLSSIIRRLGIVQQVERGRWTLRLALKYNEPVHLESHHDFYTYQSKTMDPVAAQETKPSS